MLCLRHKALWFVGVLERRGSLCDYEVYKCLRLPCLNRSPEDVTERLDRLIAEIRAKWHAPVIGKPVGEAANGDVLIVAHGHILRAFAMRWVGKTLQDGPAFLLEAGGVGTLR
jgi:broad specificity phosphatase PhoE